MADTYQTKLTVNGRNPGDNTLEVYRTAGTDCTELAATYRNQHFWLPTGKNWMTRKWISGEDQDDGFKQCVCVNASIAKIEVCEGLEAPESFGIRVRDFSGSIEVAHTNSTSTARRYSNTISDADFNTTEVVFTNFLLTNWTEYGTACYSVQCHPYGRRQFGSVARRCGVELFRDDLDLKIKVYIGILFPGSPDPPEVLLATYEIEYTATDPNDAADWLQQQHTLPRICEITCDGTGVVGSVDGCISSTITTPDEIEIFAA